MALRMVVVEDNLLTRELIKEMIECLGHQVVAETDDLATTMAAYQQHKPDGLTIDLSLPKEDGLTILKALREADPNVRAIIVSGNSQARIKEEVLKAGAVDLLPKPIEMATLRACLGKVFPDADNA
ncbi:MAG: response regulator [Elusimicrobia bacterium]|nr:response regulator [Elusimicrobiota bacterium]